MEYIIIVILVFLSALFSGLTLGFFSLNKDDLERKKDMGNKEAKKVYRVRKDGNLLLCTLLIGNVAVNSTLSIFLGSIASGVAAGLIATALIVIFGEIIPQAGFSRYALRLGAKLAWLVLFFRFILYPICKPIALVLDKALGDEMPNVYSKGELLKIIEEHEDSKHSDVDEDEEKMVKGALTLSGKTVEEIMTPESEVFSLPFAQELDRQTINKIFNTGHSRIPVYKNDKDEIIGTLYIKDLILEHKRKNKTVGDVAGNEVIFVDYNKPLDELLNSFQSTRNHMFIVLNEYGSMLGIVTIEDVLEEIIGEEIMDEFDKVEDLRAEAKKRFKRKRIKKI